MSSHREFDCAIPLNGSHALARPAYINGHSVKRARLRLNSQTQFQIDTARRQVDQIEAMIADLDRMASALEGEIRAEENRTGIRNSAHFEYSTYARAAMGRRRNLNRSADGLKDVLNEAKAALAGALSGGEEAADARAGQVPETEPTAAPVLSVTG